MNFFGIDAQVSNRLRDDACVNFTLCLQSIERGDHDALGVDFKMTSQGFASFAAAHAVSSQDEIIAGHPRSNLFRDRSDIVGSRDEWTFVACEHLFDV